ncbi:MAG: DsbE family thiol:disulfide interchange protein [Paracoccaceae bacterium]
MADGRFNPLILLPPIIFFGLAGIFYFGLTRDDPNALPSQFIGEPAPTLTVTELYPDVKVPTDADIRAPGVKLVNFWASWCGPCRAEHPTLERMSKDGITIIGINYKDRPEDAKKFLEDLGNPFAMIGVDSSGRTGIEWGVYGVPETFVIDGDGKVVLRFPGPIVGNVFQKQIAPAIAAASK